jgi:putative ABC transport system permease protein
LGINTAQLVVIRGAQVGRDSTYKQKASLFKNKLEAMPFVKQYCATGGVPSRWYNFNGGGITRLNPQEGDDKKPYAFVIVSPEYIPTYQLKLVAGENYTFNDCNREWSEVDKIIINEKAVASFGFESPEKAIGQKVKWEKREITIKGVVKDYHHQSVQSQIDAMIFYPQVNDHYYTVRLASQDLKDKVAELEKAYTAAFPGNPFEYFFVDDVFNKSYQIEQQYGAIFTNASFLAIFIACLGLFGLATFTVEARTKEIGIRKVLGASAQSIISLISRDFLKLVFIAFVIATPIAWYATHQWLQNFPFRITVGWWIFGFAGLLSVLIAFCTIGYQAIRASRKNPVEALRYE